jgi:hypothetical protein
MSKVCFLLSRLSGLIFQFALRCRFSRRISLKRTRTLRLFPLISTELARSPAVEILLQVNHMFSGCKTSFQTHGVLSQTESCKFHESNYVLLHTPFVTTQLIKAFVTGMLKTRRRCLSFYEGIFCFALYQGRFSMAEKNL